MMISRSFFSSFIHSDAGDVAAPVRLMVGEEEQEEEEEAATRFSALRGRTTVRNQHGCTSMLLITAK